MSCWSSSQTTFVAWRRCLAKYMDKSLDDAKTELIRIFYGGQPSVQAPFLLKLCDEVQKAAEAILNHPSASAWAKLYSDRRNPEFSRLSALLSFDEAEMLTAFMSECSASPNVLIFDGGYVKTSSYPDEVDMVIACNKISEELIPLHIKSWADNVHPSSSSTRRFASWRRSGSSSRSARHPELFAVCLLVCGSRCGHGKAVCPTSPE